MCFDFDEASKSSPIPSVALSFNLLHSFVTYNCLISSKFSLLGILVFSNVFVRTGVFAEVKASSP